MPHQMVQTLAEWAEWRKRLTALKSRDQLEMCVQALVWEEVSRQYHPDIAHHIRNLFTREPWLRSDLLLRVEGGMTTQMRCILFPLALEVFTDHPEALGQIVRDALRWLTFMDQPAMDQLEEMVRTAPECLSGDCLAPSLQFALQPPQYPEWSRVQVYYVGNLKRLLRAAGQDGVVALLEQSTSIRTLQTT